MQAFLPPTLSAEIFIGHFGISDYSLLIALITIAIFLGILKISKMFKINIYMLGIIGILGFLFIKDLQKVYYENPADNFLIIISKVLGIIFLAYLWIMLSEEKQEEIRFEYPTIIILALFGILLTLENTEGLIIFLGLEIQAFSFYTMVSLTEKDIYSAEGALKYFLIGAMASGVFILGLGVLYGAIGKTNFMEIAEVINNKEPIIVLGGLLVLLGLLFKIGAAPFHLWLPDAYEGAPFYVLLFLLTMPKLALFYLLFAMNNIFEQNLLIFIVTLLSAVIGSVQAFSQTKTKRFIAYTVIYNNTFFLSMLFLSGKNAFFGLMESLIMYLIITLTTAIAFLILRKSDTNLHFFSLRDLWSLKKSNGFIALVILITFFSAAGIPPFLGFFQKYIVLWFLAEKLQIFLLVLLILSSILPAFYYIRIPKITYFLTDSKTILLKNISEILAIIVSFGTMLSLAVFY